MGYVWIDSSSPNRGSLSGRVLLLGRYRDYHSLSLKLPSAGTADDGRNWRVGPGNFTPGPSQIPDVILSHHPARAIARRLPPSAEIAGSSRYDPVDPNSTAMTRPLFSTGIPPLRRYYGAVRPSPAHRYFQPRGWSRLRLVWGLYRQAVSKRRSLFLAFLIGFFVRAGIPFLRPDAQYCKAGARRSCQGWPLSPSGHGPAAIPTSLGGPRT
jgi:hypothetical protein